MRKFILCTGLLFMAGTGFGQGYQGLHGSPFAGASAVFNNPAAPVNSAYKWDLTLFSVQAKTSTNSVYYAKDAAGSGITLAEGFSSKYMHANADVSLLNFMYKASDRTAFNFNIRARTYVHSKMYPFSYTDSINSIHDFLLANANVAYLQGFVTHAGWVEGDLTWSQVLAENDHSRLSGGITLQVLKGMSGAFMRLNKLSYRQSINGTDTSFLFTGGGGSFGYSANYDGKFQDNTPGSLGLSIGAEYLVYNSDNAVNNNINYDWKIGVSILDIGANRFVAGQGSGQFSDPITTIPDNSIDTKLHNPSSVTAFRDSLNTLFSQSAPITGNFSVSLPTRMVINADKNLGNHFFVNADLSLNFFSSSSPSTLHTRELNLLTVTPRWETIAWGVYLPVQYNTQGQLWVGAAVKLGPLVLGLHNFGLLHTNTFVSGGGYLMLSVHPFNKRKILTKLDCFE